MLKIRRLKDPEAVDVDALRRAVEPVCHEHGLLLLYLHGGWATQTATSDLDLAVLVDRPGGPLDHLSLLDDLIVATGREDVDLAVLNDASDMLRFNAVTGSVLLFESSARARVGFETAARRAWFDSAPKRRERTRLMAQRAREGHFGRR